VGRPGATRGLAPRAFGIGALLALGLALGIVIVALGSATGSNAPEQASVARLPALGDHWVFVPDRLLGHSLILDGDTGRVLGFVDTPNELMFPPPLASRARGEIYSADILYARGTRGARTDFLSIYDLETLAPIGEVTVPTRLGQSNVSYGYAELLGDRFVALFDQFPDIAVSIVDLDQRAFVESIPIAGCAGIYPVSTFSFATLCGDGTVLRVDLDETGRLAGRASSAKFFDPVVDPVAMPAGRDGARWTFVTFGGLVHTVDFSGAEPVVAPSWSLLGEAGEASGWRPGGLQHVAVQPELNRLYVVMHEGGPGTHKSPGPEIWVYDLAERQRVARFEPPNLTAAFLAGIAGVDPESLTYRVMTWLLPSDGVHSIAVTRDAEPLLFARNAERGAVAVMDARTGETLRVLGDAGLAGPTLKVPGS